MVFAKRQQKIRVLLLENVNQVAVEKFKSHGYEASNERKALKW
jgi:hypothetical protein